MSLNFFFKSNFSLLLLGTQSVRPMGLTSSNETLVSRDVYDETEPTTDSTNKRLNNNISEHNSDIEKCVNHRVKVSNQYECRMLSNTCDVATTDKEVGSDIFL